MGLQISSGALILSIPLAAASAFDGWDVLLSCTAWSRQAQK